MSPASWTLCVFFFPPYCYLNSLRFDLSAADAGSCCLERSGRNKIYLIVLVSLRTPDPCISFRLSDMDMLSSLLI